MKDIHGLAIQRYYTQNDCHKLTLHNSYGKPEKMTVEVFFREEEDFSVLEHLAIIESTGKILDLGAGAGAHSLVLQGKNKDVTALENSPGCASVMRSSGVEKVVLDDFRNHKEQYDTVLILMNGLGLAGTLVELGGFLNHCKTLLKPGGQILADSSDLTYLYQDGQTRPEGYYGEIRYQYEYHGEKGDWFEWLYVDQENLIAEAEKVGMSVEILHTDENDQYLACIKVDI